MSIPSALSLPSDMRLSPASVSKPASPLGDGSGVANVIAITTDADSATDLTASSAADAGENNKPTSAANPSTAHHEQAARSKEHALPAAADTAVVVDESSTAGKEEQVASSSSSAGADPLDASYMDVMESATLLSHGQSLLASKCWNLACEALSRCVERAASQYGDTALALAPLYALYGRALLEHWTSAQVALGDKLKEAQAEKKINEGAGGLIGEDDVDEDGQTAQAEAEVSTDDSMAWEVLDLARVIYQRQYDSMASEHTAAPSALTTEYPLPVPTTRQEVGLALVSVLLRLGDLHQEQEKFVEAGTDYSQAASLQSALLPLHTRDRAATHMDLAVCSLWMQQPREALQHYIVASQILRHCLAWLAAGKPTAIDLQPPTADSGEVDKLFEQVKSRMAQGECSEEDVKQAVELVDLIAELKERIDEMANSDLQPTTSASSSSAAASSSSSSSSSNGFSSTPFTIPPLSFPVPSFSPAIQPPAASTTDESSSTKRKAEENTVEVNGKEEVEVFSVPVVKRKKI